MFEVAAQSQTAGCADWFHQHSAHMGAKPTPEPSLMMPGIIISFVFSEQRRLIVRTAPV
jgi:hypothetical protein